MRVYSSLQRASITSDDRTRNCSRLRLSMAIMVGQPNPMMGFPANTVFTPYATVRNSTAREIPLKITAYYMNGNRPVSLNLRSQALHPDTTKQLNLPGLLAEAGLPSTADNVTLKLTIGARPGEFILAGGSVDQTGTYVFSVPPDNAGPSGSVLVPLWSVAEGNDTMIGLWNSASEAQDIVLKFFSGDGKSTYLLPVHLEALAFAGVDMMQLLHSKQPDPSGNLLPVGVEQGSLTISSAKGPTAAMNVSMSVGIFNVTAGTCNTQCVSCGGIASFSISPISFVCPIGQTMSFKATGHLRDGSTRNETSAASWKTSNVSVATIRAGQMTGVSPGDVTITALLSSPPDELNCTGIRRVCENRGFSAGGSGPVTPTVVIQGNPTFVYVGQDPTVVQTNTLFGQGTPSGGTYKWSTTDSTTSFDNSAAQDVHVKATNYTGVANDTKITLDYTQSGIATSPASVSLTKRIFKFLAGDSVIKVTAFNGPSKFGYVFSASYNVFANPGGVQVTNGSGVSTSEQVTQISSNVPVSPNTGSAFLAANSQLLDTLGIQSNAPLPSNLSIVDMQDWAVGGIFVRTNTLTWTASGVTVTSQGPSN